MMDHKDDSCPKLTREETKKRKESKILCIIKKCLHGF